MGSDTGTGFAEGVSKLVAALVLEFDQLPADERAERSIDDHPALDAWRHGLVRGSCSVTHGDNCAAPPSAGDRPVRRR